MQQQPLLLYRHVLSSLLFLLSFSLAAQDCADPDPANGNYLHANNIRAFYMAAGGSFFNGSDAQFNIDDPLITSETPIATIFAHGLWMGGTDTNGNLAIAAAEYGASSGSYDYYPGPLMADGSVATATCASFDRVWSVYRYQIAAHQADFDDNGVIDDPLDAVMGWPAVGNEQFESVNGFTLPENSVGYADFADLNTNGIYEPLQGEYPKINQSDLMPDQIVWMIFNTRGNLATETFSINQLTTEVQLTAWAFNCTDNPILNYTTFASYKITNKSAESIQDFRVAFWTDFDLGCYTDDFVGSAPLQNTYFAYNQDNDDDLACAGGVTGAGENPPVQSVSFLNQSLDYFSYYSNPAFSPNPPFEPSNVQAYYNLMDGLFADGTPITRGGSGYDPSNTEEPVSHTFPDDPNDPDGWSEYSAALTGGDRRSLGSSAVGELPAGGTFTIDLAYAYHREEGADYLGNVSNMYANVADIQAAYDNGFTVACTAPIICEEDCIWPGDLNADGIANHEDLLALGFGLNESGPTRDGPYNWYPRAGESWLDNQVLGADNKHLDADGDGVCTEADFFNNTIENYNLTQPGYVPVFDYPAGDDIILERTGSDPDFINLAPGSFSLARVKLETEISDLQGIAFTVEYDPTYINIPLVNSAGSGITFNYASTNHVGHFDFAAYESDGDLTITAGTLLLVGISVNENFPDPLPTDETFVCFRNIRAYLSDGTSVELGAQKTLLQIDGITTNTREPAWAKSISVFPNPVTDRLQIQSNDIAIDQLQVFDSSGRAVSERLNNTNDMDVGTLPAGLYYLRIYREGQFVVRKFVKMY